MPTRPTGVTDTANADGVVDVDVVERPSYDITTTTTADPGSAGVSLAVTSRSRFPQSGNFKVRVEAEVMLVTAGHGTGAGNFTVTRGVDGTTAVAHTTGVLVAQVVGVQRVEPIDASRIVTYQGRAHSFRIPGRAGTTGHKLISLHNATGSLVKARVTRVWLDKASTTVIAVTALPPMVRLHKVTVLPTNGTALGKVSVDSTLVSSASIALLQDASADGTSSGTTLTATIPAGSIYEQEFGPRLITAAGYEMADKIEFLNDPDTHLTLNALEGVVLFLDYVLTTQNVATEMWLAGIEWEEYTLS